MYACWTPDDTSDLIGHLTLVLTDSIHMIYRLWWTPDIWFYSLTVLFTVDLCLHIITVSFQFILSFHMLTHYMHVHFRFYFTHSLGLFLMTLDLQVQILDILFFDQVFVEIVWFTRSWSFSLPILVLLSSFYSCLYSLLDSIYISDSLLFYFCIYWYMCEHLYIVLQWYRSYLGFL